MRRKYDGTIYRGTTTINVFVLADALQDAEITTCYATYYQHEKKVLEKSLADMTIEPVAVTMTDGTAANKRAVLVTLTQEDTLLFNSRNQATGLDDARVQLRLKTANGEAAATRYVYLHVHEILKDGEI